MITLTMTLLSSAIAGANNLPIQMNCKDSNFRIEGYKTKEGLKNLQMVLSNPTTLALLKSKAPSMKIKDGVLTLPITKVDGKFQFETLAATSSPAGSFGAGQTRITLKGVWDEETGYRLEVYSLHYTPGQSFVKPKFEGAATFGSCVY